MPVDRKLEECSCVHVERVRVEDAHGRGVEAVRKPKFLKNLERAADVHGNAAAIAVLFVHDLDHALLVALEEEPNKERIDRGTQVVEVGEHHDLAAVGDEAMQKPAASKGVDQVAVAGRVGLKLSVAVDENVAAWREANAETLIKARGKMQCIR